MALPEVAVPNEWTFPEALRRVGIEPRTGDDGRRLDYIEYELLRSAQDVKAVQDVMYGPLGEQEVEAAVATFQPEDSEERG
jgi:hypothetical protein